MSGGASQSERLIRRFRLIGGIGLPVGTVLLGLLWGGRAALAFLLTYVLITMDFLWMAHGVRRIVTPGKGVPKGALSSGMASFGARVLLILPILYGILIALPGEGPAVAAGIAGPVFILAAAGVLEVGG